MLTEEGVAYLIVKRSLASLSVEEEADLNSWLQESESNVRLYDRLINTNFADDLRLMDSIDGQLIFKKYLSRYVNPCQTLRRRRLLRIARYSVMIASVVLVAIGSSLYFNSSRTEDLNINEFTDNKVAELTLANGQVILLDESVNDAIQGVVIDVRDARVEYAANAQVSTKIEYNELSTPVGCQYQIVLSDGTKVWIGPKSTLRFPVKFAANRRDIYITGEAYFDVAKSNVPMFVTSYNGISVKVLGTSFNFKSYPEDKVSEVALERGSVKLSYNDISAIMSPGELGVCDLSTNSITVSECNTSKYTSWTTGMLKFRNESLKSIMTTLSRWYNINVQFDPAIDSTMLYSGDIMKTDNVKTILQAFVETGRITYDIINNTVTIK